MVRGKRGGYMPLLEYSVIISVKRMFLLRVECLHTAVKVLLPLVGPVDATILLNHFLVDLFVFE